MQIDFDQVAKQLAAKIADAEVRATMSEVYAVTLENRVKELEEENRGLAQQRNQEVARTANAAAPKP